MAEVATKAVDEMYCSSCGKIIKKEAAFCVHCGVAVHGNHHPVQHRQHAAPAPKDKTTAVLLAVFLGFWTWIYTYQKDAWKFWLNLVLSIITFGMWALVAWVWAVIDVAVKPTEYYQNFPN